MKVPRFHQHLIARQVLDLHDVELSLEFRYQVLDLLQASFQAIVVLCEAVLGELFVQVQLDDLVEFLREPALLVAEAREELFFVVEGFVGLTGSSLSR